MIFSSFSLDNPSALQAHLFLKTIVFNIPYTDKSNVTYNYTSIIWVQDQAFTDWHVAWVWITKITDKVTRKGWIVDLATQFIKNLNAQSKIVIKVDKLFNKDWGNIGISKNEKKVPQKGLALYVKATKTNTKCRTNCLKQIEQTWSVNNCNKFHWLHYPKSNKTFFWYITIVIKLSQTPRHQ